LFDKKGLSEDQVIISISTILTIGHNNLITKLKSIKF